MKKVLLGFLALILVLGMFAAVGFTGYRFGYGQGVQTAANGDTIRPGFDRLDEFDRRGMDGFGGDREFQRGMRPGGFRMHGFGLFAPLRFLVQVAVLGLIVWFVYWLFTRSGWQLTRTQTVQATETRAQPTEPEEKESE